MRQIRRYGIELDVCPTSGGVWLDKGMKAIFLAPLLLTAACSHTGMYALSDSTPADQAMTFNGTVLSVEADGDFLLETSGRLLLVDVGDTGAKVELGDRVTVTGRTDNDKDEAEAPELDAGSVADWLPPSP
jgi:hypothetical protein